MCYSFTDRLMEIHMGRLRQVAVFWMLCVSSLAVVSSAAVAQGRSGQPVVALVDGTVIGVDEGRSRENAVVLIQGDRISQVGTAGTVTIPAGAQVISMKGRWLIPGLMNLHVHLGLRLPGA